MDRDIAQLVHEARVAEAAQLAASRGDVRLASELFERACDWKRAAEAGLAAGDPARALLLAVLAHDDATASTALTEMAKAKGNAETTARTLEQRGDAAWAARAYEAAGLPKEAARAWDRAGDCVKASAILESAGDAAGAARLLEAAIRRSPEVWSLHVALGALLLRYGKDEAALRALQKVPRDAPERSEAVAWLMRALARLGLTEALAEAKREADPLGDAIPTSAPSTRAPAPAANAKARLFGRYEVEREIASSAAARVIECIDVVHRERVAVKIFAGYDARGAGRDALARFEREVRVLKSLDHPNVVPLREYVPEGPAIVLAWMPGGTLESMMASGAIAPARAVEIACAVLAALGEAHRLGVLHRDVKPANVLFDDAGVARLGDFGVAHLGDLSATATAGIIGTLAYMSPEQREGRPATVRSDVYGVGMLLFEMLTGERERTRTQPSASHRDLDTRHDEAALRMIALDPSERPEDAFTARRALTSLAWPAVLEPAAPRGATHAPSDRPQVGRVEMQGERAFDRWMGRAFETVPLGERALARAAGFARAGHRALQMILRVDRDDAQIWLEAISGRALEGALTAAQTSDLASALAALHQAGIAHGRIDRDHVVITDDDSARLRFASSIDPARTEDDDRSALASLAR